MHSELKGLKPGELYEIRVLTTNGELAEDASNAILIHKRPRVHPGP